MCSIGQASDCPAVRCLRHHYYATIIKILLLPANVEILVKAFKVVHSFAHVDDVPLQCHTWGAEVKRWEDKCGHIGALVQATSIHELYSEQDNQYHKPVHKLRSFAIGVCKFFGWSKSRTKFSLWLIFESVFVCGPEQISGQKQPKVRLLSLR